MSGTAGAGVLNEWLPSECATPQRTPDAGLLADASKSLTIVDVESQVITPVLPFRVPPAKFTLKLTKAKIRCSEKCWLPATAPPNCRPHECQRSRYCPPFRYSGFALRSTWEADWNHRADCAHKNVHPGLYACYFTLLQATRSRLGCDSARRCT